MPRYFDGERAVPYDVTLHLTADALLINAVDGTELANWPLAQISVDDSSVGLGTVAMARRGQPARLIVDDRDLLAGLARAGVRIRSEHAWHARHWALLAGGILVALVAAVLLLDAFPQLVAPLIPAAWEDRLGAWVEASLTRDQRICAAPVGQHALETLVGRLRAAGGIEPTVNIVVLDDPTVNALTLPGGRVVVMRGLIDKAEDGAELAGVIAHELGHVAHRDPTTMLLRQAGIGFVAGSLGWNDALANAGGLAQNLLTLSYSRQAEAAADASGEAFLSRAGLRADGLGRFFARLEASEGHGGIALLATHPPTEERREHATRSTVGAPPFTDTEWAAVRGMCQ